MAMRAVVVLGNGQTRLMDGRAGSEYDLDGAIQAGAEIVESKPIGQEAAQSLLLIVDEKPDRSGGFRSV